MVYVGPFRLSTAVAISAFIVLALVRRDRKPLLAGWAWFWGFEAAYQLTGIAVGRLPFSGGYLGDIDQAILLIVLGVVTVPMFWRQGIRPSLPLVGLTAAVWAAWVATGFHFNGHGGPTDPAAEVFNEGAKTLLALAYLWPFWRRSDALPEVQAAAGIDVPT